MRRSAARTLAAIVPVLLVASVAGTAAQEGEVEPPGAPAAVAATATAADEAPLPALLRDVGPVPYAGAPVVLTARRLRGLAAGVAGQILRGEVGGEIGVAALATPLPPPAGGDPAAIEVPLFIEIDGASFLDANRAEVARLEVYAYAVSATGGVAGYLAEAFAVDVGEIGEAVWQSGLKFYGRLRLAPGDYVLRVMVRNQQSGATGITGTPLVVPAAGAGSVTTPPLFPPPPGRDAWLPVRSWGEGPESPAPPYPFVDRDAALSPSALPVLTAGRAAEARLFLRRPLPGTSAVVHIRGTSGGVEVVAELAAGGAPGNAADVAALTPWRLRFTPPEVPAGEYALTVELRDATGRALATTPPVTALLVTEDSSERAPLWTDLRWRIGDHRIAEGAAALEPGGEPQGRGRRSSRGVRRMAAAYREAIMPLAAGSSERALAALLDFESAVLSGDSKGSIAGLQEAAMRVAEELADESVESLPPLFALHEELYLLYRRRRLFSLGTHNRLLVERLAELYAGRGGSPEVAARALTGLGGTLAEASLPSSAVRLLRRALELDPGNRAARLTTAAIYERYGEYRRAAEYLEPLVAEHPGDPEGRLRLAINLQRSGDRRRGRQLLEELAGDSGPAWVRSLAVQELARGLLAAGSVEEAVSLLEDAVAALPGDPGPLLLLAHAYDRQRRPMEALDLLAAVRADPAGRESPRRLYDSLPEEALADNRRRLASAAAERQPLLSAALGS